MKLNKAEVLFMFDHVNDAQRRMMVESLLDRIIALEANQTEAPNAEVETFLAALRTSASAAAGIPDPSADTKS